MFYTGNLDKVSVVKLFSLWDLKPTNPKDIVDAIAQEAERLWGEDWFVHR